jgi:hypothetical protein
MVRASVSRANPAATTLPRRTVKRAEQPGRTSQTTTLPKTRRFEAGEVRSQIAECEGHSEVPAGPAFGPSPMTPGDGVITRVAFGRARDSEAPCSRN